MEISPDFIPEQGMWGLQKISKAMLSAEPLIMSLKGTYRQIGYHFNHSAIKLHTMCSQG